MASLQTLLPAPTQSVFDRGDEDRARKLAAPSTHVALTMRSAPPYGMRKGWVPRSLEDYGDGGAFPEIHVAQYPMDMGKKKDKTTSNALPVQIDAQGKIKYDVIVRQGQSKDKVIYHRYQDMLPSEITTDDDPTLQKPDEEAIEKTTEETRLALEKLTQSKISAAMPVRAAEKTAPAQYIRYTPSQQGPHGAAEVQDQQENSRVVPPSPPAPVMHSPTRKVTVKEQQEWRIPPCISNWKNAKGYTVPLDKRLAADGRGLQQVHINENFAKLAEALYIADRKAREAVEMRAQLEKKLAQKEKEKKEEHLRQLAQRAREERAGIRTQAAAATVDEDVRERDQLRHERHKDRQRERNIARAAPDKRSKLEKQRERDISEQIALGMPGARPAEVQFDQRLFNQSKGLDTGFGHDDAYDVYDKPWRSTQTGVYRPKNQDKEVYGEDLEKLMKTSRFVPDKEFSGTDRSSRRDGPVQFERLEEEDPFGLDKFLTEAKKASKRPTEEQDHHRDKGKRRKE
ncbi:hypothetical protein MRX96_002409 [Rhipicephalus microplus]